MNILIKKIQYDSVQNGFTGLNIEVKLRFFGKIQGEALVVLFFVNLKTGEIVKSESPEWADDRGDFITTTDFFAVDGIKKTFSFNFFVPYGVLRISESSRVKITTSCVLSGVKAPVVAEKVLEYYVIDPDYEIPPAIPPKMDIVIEYSKRLGIASDATFEDIKLAYKTKCKEFHPDLYQNLPMSFQEFAKQEFQKIQEAFAYFRELYNSFDETLSQAS
ncbi:MAG: J domain-containing protein [Candidatus Riflebacteria bacterium]|nr:J domain-containing protein [Candidatus Riflebacteria bacterium]